jgi:hypothetical protein
MDVYSTWNLFHAIHDNWNLSPGCLFQEEIENILPTRKRLSLHEILHEISNSEYLVDRKNPIYQGFLNST